MGIMLRDAAATGGKNSDTDGQETANITEFQY